MAAVILLLGPRVVLINYSRSFPLGFYRVSLSDPARGSLVAVCPPAHLAHYAVERHYISDAGICPTRTAPLLKVVAGVAGDLILIRPAGVACNGVLLPASRRAAADRHGRPHDLPPFSGAIPAGAVWLHAPHPDSWDSRYFGPLPGTSILKTLKPLLVW